MFWVLLYRRLQGRTEVHHKRTFGIAAFWAEILVGDYRVEQEEEYEYMMKLRLLKREVRSECN